MEGYVMRGPVIAGVLLLLAGGTAAAADHQITIKNMKFTPAKVSAKVGDTLTFVNNDADDHDLYTSSPGFGINLPNVTKNGGTTQMALHRAGHFDLECGLHPDMLLKVSVAK
jgi:cytochrome c peroxidase